MLKLNVIVSIVLCPILLWGESHTGETSLSSRPMADAPNCIPYVLGHYEYRTMKRSMGEERGDPIAFSNDGRMRFYHHGRYENNVPVNSTYVGHGETTDTSGNLKIHSSSGRIQYTALADNRVAAHTTSAVSIVKMGPTNAEGEPTVLEQELFKQPPFDQAHTYFLQRLVSGKNRGFAGVASLLPGGAFPGKTVFFYENEGGGIGLREFLGVDTIKEIHYDEDRGILLFVTEENASFFLNQLSLKDGASGISKIKEITKLERASIFETSSQKKALFAFSKDGKALAHYDGNSSNLKSYTIENGVVSELGSYFNPRDSSIGKIEWLPDGSKVLVFAENNLYAFDPSQTGQYRQVGNSNSHSGSAQLSNSIYTATVNFPRFVPNNGDYTRNLSLPVAFAGATFDTSGTRLIGRGGGRSASIIVNPSVTCVSPDPLNTWKSDLSQFNVDQARERVLSRVTDTTGVCNIKEQDLFSSGDPKSLNSVEDGVGFLLYLQKPGNFVPNKHLATFRALLKEGIAKLAPDLVAGAMNGILAKSSVLFETLVQEFHGLGVLPVPFEAQIHPAKVCLSEEDVNAHTKNAEEYVDNRVKIFLDYDDYHSLPASLKDWKYLGPLAPYLSLLPVPRKEELVDLVGDTVIVGSATQDHSPRLQSLEEGIRTIYANHAIAPYIGLATDNSHRMDYQIRMDRNQPVLTILSTKPIQIKTEDGNPLYGHSSEADYGFHNLQVLRFPPTDVEHSYKVMLDHEEWKLTVSPGASNRTTMTSDEVSAILHHKNTCRFVSHTSHWHIDGVLAERLKEEPHRKPRTEVVEGSAKFLESCERMKAAIGEEKCEAVEFAGHHGGCSSRDVFGVYSALRDGTLSTFPKDKTVFDKSVACVKSLLKDETRPLIFTSCFSGSADSEMDALVEKVGNPVIGAAGLCSSDGWGAYCKKDFVQAKPTQKSSYKFEKVR